MYHDRDFDFFVKQSVDFLVMFDCTGDVIPYSNFSELLYFIHTETSEQDAITIYNLYKGNDDILYYVDYFKFIRQILKSYAYYYFNHKYLRNPAVFKFEHYDIMHYISFNYNNKFDFKAAIKKNILNNVIKSIKQRDAISKDDKEYLDMINEELNEPEK
eukprot:Mrub_12701.p1 GENE.Mrub_12701~~Mrub_12701.p1  ORF type:complete len:181 (-),score=10.82 Mrub_12701:8-484(-)